MKDFSAEVKHLWIEGMCVNSSANLEVRSENLVIISEIRETR